jgi:hypothetical protein
MITDTLDGMLQNQTPWIREYFHGPRARAAGRPAPGAPAAGTPAAGTPAAGTPAAEKDKHG